jgi:hypothetical protein
MQYVSVLTLCAWAGVIPPLQRIIRQGSAHNQFAYPIACWLGLTSATYAVAGVVLSPSLNDVCACRTRNELRKYNGVQFFVDILKDSYWRTHALEVLTVWWANSSNTAFRCHDSRWLILC